MNASQARSFSFQISILLVAALALGGGGVAYGLANLAVLIFALVVLALHRATFAQFWISAPLPLRALAAASIALPLLQLVPLPPAIWSSLPGRALAVEARQAVGDHGWHAMSLAPHRTLVAALGLVVPITLLSLGHSLDGPGRERVRRTILAMGVVNILIGAVQVTSNGASAIIYPENPMPGVMFGLFANRNTIGIFLVACLALTVLPRLRRHSETRKWFTLGLAALFVTGVVLTGSRSAIVLALLPIGLAVLRRAFSRSRMGVLVLGTAAVIGVAALTVLPQTRVHESLQRFEQVDDTRTDIWPDATAAAARYFPVGAGMGTFDEVFQVDESLEHIGTLRAGRAHNDYLEIAIEAGIAGLVILASWLALVGWLTLRASGRRKRWEAWSGSMVVAAIALQSLVDYPLRTQAMLAVAAFALVLLTASGRREGALA